MPAAVVDLARRGQWRDAFDAVAPTWRELLASNERSTLLWMYELCLRLGLDGGRRFVARALLREHRDHPAAFPLRVLEPVRRGLFADAWHASRLPLPADATPAESLAWSLARARLAYELRHHELAAHHLAAARAIDADAPALANDQAWAHLAADRVADALAVCDAALARHPDHAVLRQTRCWIRHDANLEDAGATLAEACTQLQSPYLDSLYANHCYETGDLATARRCWEQMLEQPLHERRSRQTWRFALVRVCRQLGDDAAALRWAEAAGRAGDAYRERLQQHLAAAPAATPTRVVLPVPFVRQDHLTCSPATMASLLATFGVHLDQREIAAQITYDGTGSQDELEWARQRGLVARFFQFTQETAWALLDLGLPFAISTRFETNAHRQAVVGYDRVLQTFLLRDPTGNYRREVDASWLTTMVRRGGDCALLLPAEVAARIPLPPLPGEAETLQWLQLRLDLEARRMAEFERGVDELLPKVTGALRVDILSRLYRERGDRRDTLKLWRDAQAEAPDDPYWQFHLAAELLDQSCWHEARTRLEQWTAANRSPYLARLLADQWRHDARTRPAAERLMRRALRVLAREGRAWQQYATLLWDQDRKAESRDAYATAAALSPHDEWLASSYWRACQFSGEAEAGLAFLRRRVEAYGDKSAGPAGSLAEALEAEHRIDEAIEVLRAALVADDTPSQRRQLCNLLLRHHRHDDVRTLLGERERFTAIDHAMCRQALAKAVGDRAGERQALEAAVAAVPSHVEAWERLLEHMLADDGVEAATAAAERLTREQADHPQLLVALVHFHQRLDDPGRAETLLRRLVAEHPHESWLRGQLARHLLARGRHDEAGPLLAELEHAATNSSPVWVDRAEFEHARGNLDAARAAADKALELAPDNDAPLRQLLNWSTSEQEAHAAVRLAMRRFAERPIAPSVDSLVTMVRHARDLPTDEVRRWLDELASRFPSTTAPLVASFEMQLPDEPATALPIAEALVAREPWQTSHRLRLARCLRALNRRPDERQALEQLLRVDPGCVQAHVEIGESFEQEGRLPQAIAAFERGLAMAPGYATLHGMIADATYRLGDVPAALAAAVRACELDPSYSWAFQSRVRWLVELGRPDEALALAEAQVRDHPRWPTGHELRAHALAAVGRHEERIASLREALRLAPRLGGARLQLIDALIVTKRLADARSVIDEGLALLGDEPALRLREAVLLRTGGEIERSRERLREVLAAHPDFDAGWRRLLEWSEEEGRTDDILALHRDPPAALRDEPVLFGYAADALKSRGKLDDAIAALEQALAKDQGYQWARDQLCDLSLQRSRPQRVLELLPDHAHPDRLPSHLVMHVAKAAAHLGKHELARDGFQRLLRDESLRGMAIVDVDTLLREKLGKAHDRDLDRFVREHLDDTAVVLNHLRVLAGRREHARFFEQLTQAHTGLRQAVGDEPVAAVLTDARRHGPLPGMRQWVAQNLQPPIRDTRAAGMLMHALSHDRECQQELLRLFGDDWRRPDIEGWMLANLGEALLEQGRDDDVITVSDYALASVPHDHSYWWHRRHLAEVALRRGNLVRVRELCVMPIASYPTVRLAVHQLDLAAQLRGQPWWRRGRLLRAALGEMFRHYDAARAEYSNTSPRDLLGRYLWPACPGPVSLLLCAGNRGVRLLRRLAAV